VAVVRVKRKKGFAYRVRWRYASGRWGSRTFARKSDADAFDSKVKVEKRKGDLADLDAGKQRIEKFIAEWWKLDAEPRLAASTLNYYAWLRDKHILPRLGQLELRQVTAERLQRFQKDMLQAGTGDVTTRKALVLLQGVLERAVEWRRISSNPARSVRKPPASRTRDIVPISPRMVERMRAELRRKRRLRDATLITLLAYTGLRPGEALALTWGDIRDRSIRVTKRVSLGVVREGTKSRQRSRRQSRF